MNLPTILNVVIGLIFVYLILSLLSSEIQELIATLLQWRAKHLQQSIELLIYGGNKLQSKEVKTEEILNDINPEAADLSSPTLDSSTLEAAAPFSNLANRSNTQSDSETDIRQEIDKTKYFVKSLYENPLIKSLNQEANALNYKSKENQQPKSLIGQIKGRLNPYKISGPSYIPSDTFATALITTIIRESASLKNKLEVNSVDFQQALNEPKLRNILPEDLRITLLNLAEKSSIKVASTKKEIDQLQQEIASWFDESMERSSGVYKRNAKGISFLIGLLISLATNADTLNITNRLYKNQNLPTAVNQITENIVANNNGCFQETNREDCLNNINSTLNDFSSLPVGWNDSNVKQQWQTPQNLPNDLKWLGWLWTLIKMIVGFLLTTIAIGMGAPFWFELLGKFINVRNTGKTANSSVEK